jgi:hypothetical protein
MKKMLVTLEWSRWDSYSASGLLKEIKKYAERLYN